jgi:hypothetical protein
MTIHHTDHSISFLREYLLTNTSHALIPRISFSEFYIFALKFISPLVFKILMSVKYE